jgi:polyhydroxyalkanoate synthesis regulator phasin
MIAGLANLVLACLARRGGRELDRMMRNLLLAGLGAAVLTREKILEVAQRWVDQGQMSREQAESLADDLLEESRRQARSMGDKMEQSVKSVLEEMGVATSGDLSELKTRLAALEYRVAGLETAGARAAGPEPPEPPEGEAGPASPGPASDQMPPEK